MDHAEQIIFNELVKLRNQAELTNAKINNKDPFRQFKDKLDDISQQITEIMHKINNGDYD